jgi:hypothetical protein
MVNLTEGRINAILIATPHQSKTSELVEKLCLNWLTTPHPEVRERAAQLLLPHIPAEMKIRWAQQDANSQRRKGGRYRPQPIFDPYR